MSDTQDNLLNHQVQEAVTGLTQIAEKLAGYVERLVLLEERNNHSAERLEEHKIQVAREIAELKSTIAATIVEMKSAADKDRDRLDEVRTKSTRFQTIFSIAAAAAIVIVPIVVTKVLE